MPAINAHGEFTPTPENHMTPRPHPSVTSIGFIFDCAKKYNTLI